MVKHEVSLAVPSVSVTLSEPRTVRLAGKQKQELPKEQCPLTHSAQPVGNVECDLIVQSAFLLPSHNPRRQVVGKKKGLG